ncbi:MAG: lytic murein transglycosylase [Thermodesulfobacteria bacterium]|nr:lytic murein transglycosylase [Thermodesulfobacteriota bacterium]
MIKRIFFLLVFLLWSLSAQAADLSPLKDRLVKAGFDASYVEGLLSRPEARFLPQIMPKKLLHDEYKLNYNQFLAPERVARAKKFLREHHKFLTALEERYGVPKEVLVAIFLVETDLGRYTGRYRTFNVLGSMALSEDWNFVRGYLPRDLPPEEETRLKRFMARRAKWAFRELCALITYSRQNDFDPLSIKGSIFGAFGLPQFVPTSALSYGVDWDGDGRVDLFDLEDALASMANYLHRRGWRGVLSYEAQIKVIKTYNNSQPYAETVLKLAAKLRDAA